MFSDQNDIPGLEGQGKCAQQPQLAIAYYGNTGLRFYRNLFGYSISRGQGFDKYSVVIGDVFRHFDQIARRKQQKLRMSTVTAFDPKNRAVRTMTGVALSAQL